MKSILTSQSDSQKYKKRDINERTLQSEQQTATNKLEWDKMILLSRNKENQRGPTGPTGLRPNDLIPAAGQRTGDFSAPTSQRPASELTRLNAF